MHEPHSPMLAEKLAMNKYPTADWLFFWGHTVLLLALMQIIHNQSQEKLHKYVLSVCFWLVFEVYT